MHRHSLFCPLSPCPSLYICFVWGDEREREIEKDRERESERERERERERGVGGEERRGEERKGRKREGWEGRGEAVIVPFLEFWESAVA